MQTHRQEEQATGKERGEDGGKEKCKWGQNENEAEEMRESEKTEPKR